MENKLLDTLLDWQTKGYKADSGTLKPIVWTSVLEAVRTVTTQTLNVQKMKRKFDILKSDWKVWRHLVEQSGHGWDEERGVPTAEASYSRPIQKPENSG